MVHELGGELPPRVGWCELADLRRVLGVVRLLRAKGGIRGRGRQEGGAEQRTREARERKHGVLGLGWDLETGQREVARQVIAPACSPAPRAVRSTCLAAPPRRGASRAGSGG